ncbi:fungal-specific transcription factor domain-containing protein [Achaetomium macrosporum]|uniref:Fungal-specific transcription factor domain-containing protein n=1 Tax=Achaetomium macrosporum TaxID=79813 RepID=A0AAN7C5Z4_9PEZI|nr:fungal-specific transcription factor domain-containing protein [Achaetomium macrosporum]
MDPAAVFYHSLGAGLPSPLQQFFTGRHPVPGPYPWDNPEHNAHDAPHRVAHTLTACCRCRQRKTRCDPALPRCLPCERSGSTCEYYDSAKGKKINRTYVVSLQKKVRELEAELAQYTDQESEYPLNHDDMVCPGGIVRLDETDEMPRYLGPSSGTAMTRLLMEEAKRFAESRRIANLIPAVLARRAEQRDRMQSVVMGGSISGPSGRKKSYPAHSIIPASSLPSKEIVVGLARAFNDRVQLFAPILHEKKFEEDVEAVFSGDTDPYKHFTVNMVVAISLQKMGKYAGLPDSYYLNAMRRFEDVVRPQDLKTLQCLVLIGQYALMTPTRTAVYYVIGLATRICQQMGLGDERTIGVGVSDPQTLDMRRRLSWIVTSHELGLAFSMGRPNGFAKSADLMNVKFFETVADEDITPDGIRGSSPCERKLVAIHFCKMRLLQAEIRRVLYEKKRPEPSHENHPWFAGMEQKLKSWLDACPEQPAWCRPLLVGYYHNMVIALYRPNPQVRRPTSNAAMKCFGASRYIIDTTSQQIEQQIKQQVERQTVDITLDALLIIYASLNALLWSISYPEVRAEHPREEVQDLAAAALEAIKLCSDRWPGSSSAVQLYTSLANACLQSYDVEEESPSPPSSSQLGTPVSRAGPISPESDVSRNTESSQAHPQSATSLFNASPFGYVFNATPDALAAHYAFDNGPSPFQQQPTFRSNSIFESPSTDSNGRRLSHLAPDFTPTDEPSVAERMPKQEPTPTATPMVGSLPTPPEPVAPPPIHHNNIGQSPSPVASTTQTATPVPTPTLHPISPSPIPQHTSVPIIQVQPKPQELFHAPQFKQQQQQAGPPFQRPPPPTFITPPQPNSQQRLPRPTHTTTDWFNRLPQFVPPHAFASGNNGASSFWDSAPNPFAGLGLGLTGERSEGTYTQGGGGGGGPRPSDTGYANPGNHNWDYTWGTEAALPEAAGFGPGLGLAPGAVAAGAPASDYYNSIWNNTRHGSLSQQEQLELMNVLEAEGMSDIDSFLNMGDGHGGNGAVGWGQQH